LSNLGLTTVVIKNTNIKQVFISCEHITTRLFTFIYFRCATRQSYRGLAVLFSSTLRDPAVVQSQAHKTRQSSVLKWPRRRATFVMDGRWLTAVPWSPSRVSTLAKKYPSYIQEISHIKKNNTVHRGITSANLLLFIYWNFSSSTAIVWVVVPTKSSSSLE